MNTQTVLDQEESTSRKEEGAASPAKSATLEEALEELKRALLSFGPKATLSEEEWSSFKQESIVVLTAGGEGSRLKSVTAAKDVHKTALLLPTGDTMIERTLKMYREEGFRDFVVLTYHQSHSIEEVLGDGKKLGVNIRYSADPGRPVGRGGAIRNALDNGSIAAGKSVIVHNPDDQIVGYEGCFPRDMVAAHLSGVRQGTVATVVIVQQTPYPYTAMKVEEGKVVQIEMYPPVPFPSHTGITVLGPEALAHFFDLFDLEKKSDFEKVLFPLLAADRRLYSFVVPESCWIPVNDPKALAQLIEKIASTKGSST